MFDCTKMIRYYRERKFLTQKELDKMLVIAFVSVFRWERSKFEPNMKTKKKFNTIFNEIGMKLDD